MGVPMDGVGRKVGEAWCVCRIQTLWRLKGSLLLSSGPGGDRAHCSITGKLWEDAIMIVSKTLRKGHGFVGVFSVVCFCVCVT